jgi:hypothetical protein
MKTLRAIIVLIMLIVLAVVFWSQIVHFILWAMGPSR